MKYAGWRTGASSPFLRGSASGSLRLNMHLILWGNPAWSEHFLPGSAPFFLEHRDTRRNVSPFEQPCPAMCQHHHVFEKGWLGVHGRGVGSGGVPVESGDERHRRGLVGVGHRRAAAADGGLQRPRARQRRIRAARAGAPDLLHVHHAPGALLLPRNTRGAAPSLTGCMRTSQAEGAATAVCDILELDWSALD